MSTAALVLNASFEPLCLVSRQRAVVLILDEKAEIVSASDEEVRSLHVQVRAPLVVRLLHYVKVPFKKRAKLNKRSVLARDGGKCGYCLKKAESIDHIVPRALGGTHEWLNVIASCLKCNNKKGHKLFSELGWTLKITPTVPHATFWLIVKGGNVEKEWEPYLAVG